MLTSSGATLLVGAIALVPLAVISEYRELLVIAGVALATLVVASALPRLEQRADVERHVARRLVQRGDELHVHLHVRARRARSDMRLVDQFQELRTTLEVPPIAAGGSCEIEYDVRATRRGVWAIGPLVEERTDPLGLAVRDLPHDEVDTIWVHPVIHQLRRRAALPGSRVAQRTTRRAVDAQEEFRSLREYVDGDDQRRIHWPSTARLGRLVVREEIEDRRGDWMIVLETSTDSASAHQFEEAVEIAASLCVHALRRNISVTARTRDPGAPGSARPIARATQALEMFAAVRRTPPDNTLEMRSVLRSLRSLDHVFLVSGSGLGPRPLVEVGSSAALRERLSVIRVLDDASSTRATTRTLDVRSAHEFAVRWGRR